MSSEFLKAELNTNVSFNRKHDKGPSRRHIESLQDTLEVGEVLIIRGYEFGLYIEHQEDYDRLQIKY